jgi:hypothetical protein
MNRILPRGWADGSEKTRSLSQVSVKDMNKKKKLETFAAVPGWSALARRGCSASLAWCLSTEMKECVHTVDKRPTTRMLRARGMTHHSRSPLAPRTNEEEGYDMDDGQTKKSFSRKICKNLTVKKTFSSCRKMTLETMVDTSRDRWTEWIYTASIFSTQTMWWRHDE